MRAPGTRYAPSSFVSNCLSNTERPGTPAAFKSRGRGARELPAAPRPHLFAARQRGRNPYRPPSFVCTTSVLPARTGAAVIALPSVFIRAIKLPSSRDRKCTKPL